LCAADRGVLDAWTTNVVAATARAGIVRGSRSDRTATIEDGGGPMIKLTRGDIFKAEAEALVNTVNCVGVMGRGLALQFKRAFPKNFKAYAAACKRGEVKPGRMLVVETGELANPRYIVNFPTKRHWRGKSRLADIDAGLDALIGDVKRLRIRSIAVPPLGCGLGGLDWADVRPRIQRAFASSPDVEVLLYEPPGPPAPNEGRRPTPPR
jgi:O-acetyl-ADP-ribose deacetylase (regulator of RNase III)